MGRSTAERQKRRPERWTGWTIWTIWTSSPALRQKTVHRVHKVHFVHLVHPPERGSHLPHSRAMDRHPPREKVPLEVRLRVVRLFRPVDPLEAARARQHLLDPHEIRQIVRLDPHL